MINRQITLAEIAPVNPYYVAYCAHKGIRIGEHFDTMDFMLWIHAKHTQFRALTGWAEIPGNKQYQAAFMRWLDR